MKRKSTTPIRGDETQGYDITVIEENDYCKQNCKGYRDTGGKCFVDDCRKPEQCNAAQKKAKEIAENNYKNYFEFENDGGSYDVSSYEECYKSAIQMYEWTLKQITERASKWIDNNINYNTDDKVSRTKKEILKESLLKTIQL